MTKSIKSFNNVMPHGCKYVYKTKAADSEKPDWNVGVLGFFRDPDNTAERSMILAASTWDVPQKFSAPVIFTVPSFGPGICLCDKEGNIGMMFSPAAMKTTDGYEEIASACSPDLSQASMEYILTLNFMLRRYSEKFGELTEQDLGIGIDKKQEGKKDNE